VGVQFGSISLEIDHLDDEDDDDRRPLSKAVAISNRQSGDTANTGATKPTRVDVQGKVSLSYMM
jgi:hypothetical protein